MDICLRKTASTIERLNKDSKLIRGHTKVDQDRERRRAQVLESASRNLDDFADGFRAIQATNSQEVLPIALEMLWKHFPRKLDVEDVLHINDKDNRADGKLYSSDDILQAQSVIWDLDQAWRNATNLRQHPPPPRLKDMSKICLILTGMRKRELLATFFAHELSDSDLRIGEHRSKNLLKECGPLFFTEQFRAIPRDWKEGSHEEFGELEPMPLQIIREYPAHGSYSTIHVVEDLTNNELYIRKQQRRHGSEKLDRSYQNHIEQETKRLKGLMHRHVVQFIKSYQRGGVYGLVIKPVANYDLRKLLEKYKEDVFHVARDCKDSVWLCPVFLTAFGCLAQGLRYIHGRKLRHKDVKPENILYKMRSAPQDEPDSFLWADFGLAYDFSDREDSKTRDTKLYSKRYAPREVVTANAREKAKEVGRLHTITEDGQQMIRAEMNPEVSVEEVEAHGRAADRFALGCIYFEILSRLISTELPMPAMSESPMFVDYYEGLCAWATEHANDPIGVHRAQSPTITISLPDIFQLAKEMINPTPDERPSIDHVVNEVLKGGQSFGCSECYQEHLHSCSQSENNPKRPLQKSNTLPLSAQKSNVELLPPPRFSSLRRYSRG